MYSIKRYFCFHFDLFQLLLFISLETGNATYMERKELQPSSDEGKMNIILHDNEEDLKITQVEATWVTSLSSLGFPIGAVLSSLFIDMMGKKWTAVFGQAASYCIGYLLITFSVNVECLYAGRFMCGICQVRVNVKICKINL